MSDEITQTYLYTYKWQDLDKIHHIKYFYAKSQYDANKQFEETLGFKLDGFYGPMDITRSPA